MTRDRTVRTVSVVMAVLDEEVHVQLCLSSLVQQGRPPDEMILVDDGSTDETPRLLDEFASRHPGVTVIHRSRGGDATAMALGIEQATGDMVVVADADDYSAPDRIEQSMALMSHTDADLVGGQTVTVAGRRIRLGRSRFPVDPPAIAERIGRGMDPLPHTTMALRRSSIEEFGTYRPLSRATDLELMLRWSSRGARIAVSPDEWVLHRIRREHFSPRTQFGWMQRTAYARAIAPLADDEVPSFDSWVAGRSDWGERREAGRRVTRLVGRLTLATLQRDRPRSWEPL